MLGGLGSDYCIALYRARSPQGQADVATQSSCPLLLLQVPGTPSPLPEPAQASQGLPPRHGPHCTWVRDVASWEQVKGRSLSLNVKTGVYSHVSRRSLREPEEKGEPLHGQGNLPCCHILVHKPEKSKNF